MEKDVVIRPFLKPPPEPHRRLLPWMELGEAIEAAYQRKNTAGGRLASSLSPCKIPAKDVRKTLDARLLALKHSLQEPIHGAFLASLLKWDRKEPEGQDDLVLLLVASICWMRLTGWSPESRINTLCMVLSCALRCPAPEAVVRIRYATHSNVVRGVLNVKDENVYLARPVAVFLSDGTPGIMRSLMGTDEPCPFNRGSAKSEAATKEETEKRFQTFIRKLPVLRPAELEREILSKGYVSQEKARRAICLAASRHVRRLRALHVDGRKAEQLAKRDCLLFVGPSGCGKTHLLETVFGRILNLPFVVFDSGMLTEYPYVGAKVETFLGQLVQSAQGNQRIAEHGVICLDEIDKTAGFGTADGTMPGESANRDPAGVGSQKTLLKLLEGGTISVVPMGRGYEAWTFSARDTLVVAAGAFTALYRRHHLAKPIGFGGDRSQSIEKPAGERRVETEDLVRFGMTTEFIGRFNGIIPFVPLAVDDLRQILTRNVVPIHQAELEAEGISLSVDEGVIRHLVEEAAAKGTGARGLHSCLSAVMQGALFEVLSVDGVQRVRLVLGRDGVEYEIERRPGRRYARNPTVETHAETDAEPHVSCGLP